MPRFHFNVYDGVEIPDKIGVDLPDFNFARREAIRYAGSLFEEAGFKDSLGEEWRMEVTDEAGLKLFVLNFMISDLAAAEMASSRKPSVADEVG